MKRQSNELRTELDEVQGNLRLMAERYALATTAAKVGVWDWNIADDTFYLDPNVKALLGYEDHEIPNDLEAWAGYVHPDDRDAVMAAAQDVIEGRVPEYVFEHRMLHKNGQERWIMVRGSVIRNAAGDPVRFVGTDTDITDRKLLEQKLSELSSEAQTRIGHDLHDGLAQEFTGIAYLLRSLEQALANEDSPHTRKLRELRTVVDHAITNTREMARTLSPVLDDATGLGAGLANLASQMRKVYKIECLVEKASELPSNLSVTHCNHVYRVAQEATVNAITHGRARRVEIRFGVVGPRFELRISDDGSGIGASHSRSNGMGLRIMDFRVRSMGGILTVQKHPDGGTVVHCSCPLPKQSGPVDATEVDLTP